MTVDCARNWWLVALAALLIGGALGRFLAPDDPYAVVKRELRRWRMKRFVERTIREEMSRE